MTRRVTARRPSGLHTLTVLLALAVPLALAGCDAGPGNETAQENATNNTATASVGSLKIDGARLVPATTLPTASPDASSQGVQAYLMLSVVNHSRQPDSLSNVTISGGSVLPGASTTSLTIPPRQTLQFGNPDLGISGPTLEVGGFTDPPEPGTSVDVTVTFASSGSAHLAVPVLDSESVGSTATAEPIVVTGTYPTPSTEPAEGAPTPTTEPTNEPAG